MGAVVFPEPFGRPFRERGLSGGILEASDGSSIVGTIGVPSGGFGTVDVVESVEMTGNWVGKGDVIDVVGFSDDMNGMKLSPCCE